MKCIKTASICRRRNAHCSYNSLNANNEKIIKSLIRRKCLFRGTRWADCWVVEGSLCNSVFSEIHHLNKILSASFCRRQHARSTMHKHVGCVRYSFPHSLSYSLQFFDSQHFLHNYIHHCDYCGGSYAQKLQLLACWMVNRLLHRRRIVLAHHLAAVRPHRTKRKLSALKQQHINSLSSMSHCIHIHHVEFHEFRSQNRKFHVKNHKFHNCV